MTPLSRYAWIIWAEYPRTEESTRSVCWPRVGGPLRIRFSASLNPTAGPTCQVYIKK